MNHTFLTAVLAALVVAPLALAHVPPGTPKLYCETTDQGVHDYAGAGAFVLLDGSAILCASDAEDGPVGPDNHEEWGLGGARLDAGSASVDCFGTQPHHDAFGPITVEDVLLGSGATFTVAVDSVSLTGEPCGDGELDTAVDCVGSCSLHFGPGLDGAYWVFVQGTAGHVYA